MTRVKVAAAVIAAVFVTGAAITVAAPAFAHVATGHHATCVGPSLDVASFPSGSSVITFHVGGHTATDTVTGPSDTASQTWAHLGITPTGTVTWTATWTADGGSSAGPFTFDAKSCAVPPPTTSPETIPPVVTTSLPDDTTPPVPPGRTPDAPVKAATPTATAGPAPIVVSQPGLTG